MNYTYTIFCPACNYLVLQAPQCSQCGWVRSATRAQLGEPVSEPLPLGRTVVGEPVMAGEMVWYAAPPEERDEAGVLLAVNQTATLVRRFNLAELVPSAGQPTALTLVTDGKFIFVTLLDYSVVGPRGAKAILALEPHSGQVAWQTETPSIELSSATFHQNHLFTIGAAPDGIYRLDTTTHQLHTYASIADVRYRPAVAENSLIFTTTAFANPGQLVALDLETGQELWRKEAERGYSQPVAAGDLVYTAGAKHLWAFSTRSGDVVWQYADLRRTGAGLLTAPPTVYEDTLLVVSGGMSADGKAGYTLQALDRFTGIQRWAFAIPVDMPGHVLVSPVVLGGDTVIIGDRQGQIHAVRLADGKPIWQTKLDARLTASPLAFGDTVWLPTRDGFLHQLRWREPATIPPESPAYYSQQEDWQTAAVAYALSESPDYQEAGQCLLKLNQYEQALQLFALAGDNLAQAEILAELGQYEEALTLYPPEEPNAQKAEWLLAAGRTNEAAEIYAANGMWAEAGQAYEQAQRPIKAIEAYKKADQEADVYRLGDQLDIGRWQDLKDKGVGFFGWRKVVERYQKEGQLTIAVDLLEQNEAWAEAISLRRQLGHWKRVRELCDQQNEWEGEAEACCQLAQAKSTHKQQAYWYSQAAVIYREHDAWAQAAACYQQADQDQYEDWVAMMAKDARYVEAAERLMQIDAAQYGLAGDCFFKAAETEATQYAEGKQYLPEIAALYERAAHCYGLQGLITKRDTALSKADYHLKRPRLILKHQGKLDQPLRERATATFHGQLTNEGHAPAYDVQAFAYSIPSLKCDRDNAQPASDKISVLASGQSKPIRISFVPLSPGQGDNLQEFNFIIRYQVDGGDLKKTEPFNLVQEVIPDYTLAGEGETRIVNVHNNGTYYNAGGDQVNMQRTQAAMGMHLTSDGFTQNKPTKPSVAINTPTPQHLSLSDQVGNVVPQEERKCPDCQDVVDREARYCANCGKSLELS